MKNANVQFHEGEANTVSVAITDDGGDALDLNGMNIGYRVLDPSGQNVVLDFNIGSGITVDDEAGGLISIEFIVADTTQEVGQYPHEIRLESAGYSETVMTGFLTISDSTFVGV